MTTTIRTTGLTFIGDLPPTLALVQEEIRTLARIRRTAPDQARYESLCERSMQLQRIETKAAKRSTKRAASPAPRATAPARAIPTPRFDPTRARPSELRDAALKIVERERNRLTSTQADHLDMLLRVSEDHRDATMVARWVVMTENPHYRSAFWKTLKEEHVVFTPAETFVLNRFRETFDDELRAASESGSFGLAIPATVDPSIVPSAQELAPIVQLCTTVTLMTNVYKGVTSVGSAWGFQTEGSVVADDTPVLVQPSVPIHTARSFVPASIEVSMDYPDFAAEITRTLARGYADLLSLKSAVGSGTGEPTGLFTSMANTTTNPSHVVVTTAGRIGAVDVRAAWSSLPQRFRANATWVMHEDVLSQVRNIAGAASQIDVVTDRQGVALMGRPVVTTSYAPDFTGTSGSESFLVVGDLSGYTVAHRLGVTVEMIPTMRDNTGRPIGERGFLGYARVGADVTVPPALALLANS